MTRRKASKQSLPVTRATIVRLQKRIAWLERQLRDQIEDHTLTNLALREAETFEQRDERAVNDAFARKLQQGLNEVYAAMDQLRKAIDAAIAGPWPLLRPKPPSAAQNEAAAIVARLKKQSWGLRPDATSPGAAED